jgi:hypothetical protein
MAARLHTGARHPGRAVRHHAAAARRLAELPGRLRGISGQRVQEPLRARHPAHPGHRRLLPDLRRGERTQLAAQPAAADPRQARMGADRRRGGTAGPADRGPAAGSLWRGIPGRRRPPAGRRSHRQPGLHPGASRGQAAGRTLPAALRRRPRPRAGRALVGAGRPHPGAVGRGLRAGKPSGAQPRLSEPLQRHEREAVGALLRRFPPGPGRRRRARRPAHLPADAGAVQRDLFRAGAPGWSRATS